jgi:chemotaxis protein CheX
MSDPVVLPARLDTSAAITLARALQEHEGKDVLIDASGVDLVGAKAMETLLVAAASWRAAGRSFSIASLPDSARRQLSAMGLDDLTLLEGALR